ncbi:hypothetical protein [Ralstonia mannitolilytica]|uniref:hypothetical protein n=1 Tax=Ralstonia mannitolilytica TaxID=105219 RepID=UPI00292EDF1B|nr:hypothetical protein [Ralstonia mannitolilytica]
MTNGICADPALRTLSGAVRYMPLAFACFWLLFPLFLVFAGPFDFPLRDPDQLIVFLFSCVFAFAGGYLMFRPPAVARLSSIPKSPRQLNKMLLAACALALLLLEPSVYAYTGKHIWQVDAVLNQREAYLDLLSALEQGSPLRKAISAIRGMSAPIVYAVLPLGIVCWQDLSRSAKRAYFGVVASIVVFSVFRGTDKEIGDLLIFFLSGLAVRVGGRAVRRMKPSTRAARKAVAATIAIVLFFVVVFTMRKAERMNGALSFCLYNDVACFEVDSDTGVFGVMRFAYGMLSAYLSQGYYGLSVALNVEYAWTFGIGHSSFLVSVLSPLFDTTEIYENGLLYALRSAGWDDRYVWSSAFPWVASDLSFYGVPPFMFIVGALYAKSWFSAVVQGRISAIMVFALLTIFVVYAPANNQLAQSADYYVATIFWVIIFVLKGVSNVSRKDFIDHRRNGIVR